MCKKYAAKHLIPGWMDVVSSLFTGINMCKLYNCVQLRDAKKSFQNVMVSDYILHIYSIHVYRGFFHMQPKNIGGGGEYIMIIVYAYCTIFKNTDHRG